MKLNFQWITLVWLSLGLAACSTQVPLTPPNVQISPPLSIDQLKTTALPTRFVLPVADVEISQLKDTWGAARSHGRNHEGIDILAPRGTKVYSATNGVIVDLRNNNLGGKVIWIQGPNASWHYYAHLNAHKAHLKVGDYVQQGQHIGFVGNTGNAQATAPHLHYGLYLQGKGRGAVNPYTYLR